MLGLIIAIAVAIAAPASAGAKGQKKARAGGTHSMTGCLQKGTEANTYTLTSVEGTRCLTTSTSEWRKSRTRSGPYQRTMSGGISLPIRRPKRAG